MTIELIDKLIKSLETENISYCHWKSNTALPETLLGINDLDILVSAEDKNKFICVLSMLNFTKALSANSNWFPSICHYYGYDATCEKMVHVHLHYDLRLGYDLIKNYHVPVEKAFLDSASSCSGLKTPSSELELIVFVIRMVLKRRFLSLIFGHPRNWFNAIVGKGRIGLSKTDREDFANLQKRVDPERLEKCLCEHFPFLSIELFDHCLASIKPQSGKYQWFTAGRRLTGSLKEYSYYSSIVSLIVSTKRIFTMRMSSLFCRLGLHKPRKKRLVSGGKLIAFVGGDGAGKTTNIEAINRWFGSYFDVDTVHVGRPARTVLNYAVSVFLKIWQIITRNRGYKFRQTVAYWLIAHDRWKSFGKAMNLSAKGVIVCLDRIPLHGITTMDVPRIRSRISNRGVCRWFASREEEYHSRIGGVDKLFVLKLDPKTALERRPEDDRAGLLHRSGEIWQDNWVADDAYIVDAGQPLDEVKREIRSQVWKVIRSDRRVVEIVGLAGSGKSSVANKLAERTMSIQVRLSMHPYKARYLRHTLKLLPMLFNLWRQEVPIARLRSIINTQTTLDVLGNNKKQAAFAGKTLVFDQGPVFCVIYGQTQWSSKKNSVQIESWLQSTAKKIRDIFDIIIWLDAPNDLLQLRINSRDQEHRIKDLPQEQADEFFDKYCSCFEAVIGNDIGNAVRVEHINTAEKSIEQVAAETIVFLEVEDADGCCKE